MAMAMGALAAAGTSALVAAQLDSGERIAMQQLQNDLHILESAWPSASDPCTRWVGISCANNYVDSIDLTGLPTDQSQMQLASVPLGLEALRNLPHLRELNASGFSLRGSVIPDWLGSSLPALESLDLSSCFLNGSIPSSLATSTLVFLSLADNNLSGTIPPSFGSNFTSLTVLLLQRLDLSHNYFYGEIPSELATKFPSLTILDASYNFFNGSLPAGLMPSAVVKKNCLINVKDQHTARACMKFYTRLDSRGGSGASVAAVTPPPAGPAADQPVGQGADQNIHRNSSSRGRRIKHLVLILVGVVGGFLLIILGCTLVCCFWFCKRGRRIGRSNSMESGRVATAPGSGAEMMMMMNAAANIKATGTTAAVSAMGEVFSFQQLQQATDNFSLENLIANGHSGDLFKGVLHGTGTTVVVKRIDLQKTKVDSYLQELDVLARASHTRLVLLLGHCLDNSNEKFLVYKYARNGDLESALQKKNLMVFPPPPDDDCHHVPAAVAHVHEQHKQCDDENSSLQSLDWITRLKIAIGVAEALAYLHFECSPPIAHRDVKASSILLDDKFEVRLGSLSDARVQDVDLQPSRITRLFGLSQASDHGEPGSAAASSTYDVYSFGKVLLELVSGKQGLSRGTDPAAEAWLEWALPLISIHDKDSLPKLVDPSLIVDEDLLDEVWAMAIIARACLHTKSSKRPSIQHVLKALENPGKVIRDDILGGGESAVRARTSSHSSWNEALFGSWRHSNNNNGGNLFNLGTCSTRAGSLREDPRTITNTIGGTATSTSSTTGDERLGGVGRHVRWGSSDIVPEPVDDKTLDERTMPQGQV
ncbi:unnamed protein product [Sphagnum troendelagicum]|uniref:Protein kinase domain-containing protein n=1 Tax=Sphagnum troendelagicum TaxID=128251 RepID=A0ABP0U6W5_9BRYO